MAYEAHTTLVSGTRLSDPAKLHNLGLKLAEARREVIRSRTVVRIIRSAYRFDDLGASLETLPAKFLMLVVGNMICDCAAIFYCENLGSNEYKIVDSVGCSSSPEKKLININIHNSLVIRDNNINNVENGEIASFMNAEKILCVSDANTGYAISIGFHYNSTIDHEFDLSDQETMKDALAVYIDVLERRRTRRLLEQARQDAEARETEINEVISSTTGRMFDIISLMEESAAELSNSITEEDLKTRSIVYNISRSLVDLKDIVNVTSELINEQSAPVVMEKEWVHLWEFLNSFVRSAQMICAQQNVDIQLRTSETEIYAWLDRIWMEMILNTLLSEALFHLNGGGELFVEINQREDSYVGVSIQGHSRLPNIDCEGEKDSSNLNTTGEDSISLSIRRLIDAHNANYAIEKPDPSSVAIYLYINRSECKKK